VELAIKTKRIDIAKELVIAGANPIHPSLEQVSGVIQILEEYYEFGTNEYMLWLLREHIPPNEIPQFIEEVMALEIFNESGMRMFNEVGRHPVHAFLSCGNEEMVRKLLEHHGRDQLTVKDATGVTALQIATELGDFESVKMLLKFYR